MAEEKKVDKEKLQIAKNANYVVNNFMNEKLSLIDEKVDEKKEHLMR